MTDTEYKEREERIYKAVEAISKRALYVSTDSRALINKAYKDYSAKFRYRKHLDDAQYEFSVLTKLVKDFSKILFELEVEYKQNK